MAEEAGDQQTENGQLPPRPILLADLTAPQLGTIAASIDLVLIPVGAHEQHGPALPFGTDTLTAQMMTTLVGSLLRPRVAVAPAIPWGVSWSHLGFAGTISLRESTLIAVATDLVTSLHAHGLRRFLFVNTHGGNNAALQTAVETIYREHRVPVVASIYAYSLLANAARDVLGDDAIGHGGGDEAAAILVARPDLVVEAALGPRTLRESIRRTRTILLAAGGTLPAMQHLTSADGASGDSTHATREAGNAIVTAAATQLRAIVEELLDLDPNEIGPDSPGFDG